MYARGIDVSCVQVEPIDWTGLDFAWVKCGNGNDGNDPMFLHHITSARAAGLVVGAYHVGFPLPSDPAHPGREPELQARAHYQQSASVIRDVGDLPTALDLEWPIPGSDKWRQFGLSAAFVRGWALAYLAEAERLCGRTPVLYDGFPDYWAGIDGADEAAFARYPLWVVDYPAPWQHRVPTDDHMLVVPKPWTAWTFWQHCGGGIRLANGVPVDGNVFNGTAEELLIYAAS
jgi:lysozyme